jgi:hypothetical protein
LANSATQLEYAGIAELVGSDIDFYLILIMELGIVLLIGSLKERKNFFKNLMMN